MKPKQLLLFVLFLSLLLSIKIQNVLAQSPQVFKYQVIVRNASGEVLANHTVTLQISILQGSETGTPVYTETWTETTNQFGLINLNIGQGTSSDDFLLINWGSGSYWLKVALDENGGTDYSDMGTSQLLSVPYALYSENSAGGGKWSGSGSDIYYNDGNVGIGTGTPTKKLVIKAENDTDTLLEIQDKDGNPLMVITPSLTKFNIYQSAKGVAGGFAVGRYTGAKDIQDTSFLLVTPDSTRIYTGGTGKGVAGGFAVGRYTGAKSNPIAKYFYTDADSTRIFINESAKGVAGGFAVGRYTGAKGGIKDYFNIKASGTPQIINPSEARIFWYPLKEAFLSGRVLVESIDSVGQNSWASGYESKSIGDFSQALGYKARAFGDNSTAIGYYANAIGENSYAFGNYATAQDSGSYAIGSGAKATGLRSFAIGSIGVDSAGISTDPTIASGNYSYSFGMGSVANNQGAFAFGTQVTASGMYSLAMGYKTTSSYYYSIAMGREAYASGHTSVAMGYQTKATRNYSIAMGYKSEANGEQAIAIGRHSIASGSTTVALGWSTAAYGDFSTSMGVYSQAKGKTSTAMGWSTIAQSELCFAIGRYNVASGTNYSWVTTDPLFVIGNGSDDTHRHNAVTVLKNGNVGIDTNTPDYKLQINGDVVPEINRGGDLGTSALAWDVLYYNSAQVVAKSFTNKTLSEEILNFEPISLKNGTEKIDSESLPKELRGEKGYILSNEMTTYNYKLNYEQQVLINKQQTQIEEQNQKIIQLEQQILELKTLIQNK